jgi:uncharacterized protein
LGVVVVNVETIFRVPIFHYYVTFDVGSRLVDRIAFFTYSWLFEFKAVAVFSLLFGGGLAAMAERLGESRRRVGIILVRRLCVIGLLGVMHMTLVWNGDILIAYAFAGTLVLPLVRSSAVLSFATAALLAFVSFLPLPWPDAFPSSDRIGDHTRQALQSYAEGSWTRALTFRLRETRDHVAPLLLQTLPKVVGLMALGIGLWKVGVLKDPGRHRRGIGWFALLGITVGSAGFWLGHLPAARSLRQTPAWALLDAAASTPLGLALGAAALVGLERVQPRAPGLVSLLGSVGRMGLSAYLSQSVILGFVFYGHGLGLMGKLGAFHGALVAVTLFYSQAVLCRVWLSRFELGPLEWLTRRLAYGREEEARHADSRR